MLIFKGILGYVAYRDTFERRDENLPASVARTAITAQIPSACLKHDRAIS